MRRFAVPILVMTLALAGSFVWSEPAFAQQPAVTGPTAIMLQGDGVAVPLTITLADMKAMPRKTIQAQNTHSNKTETYEGVPLAVLLEKAGVPHGEQIRGPWLAAYVLVDAADGYRVVFSLAELDSAFEDSDVLVADTLDGTPLSGDEGPFKLVAPHEKRPSRWIRMVKSLTVVRLPN